MSRSESTLEQELIEQLSNKLGFKKVTIDDVKCLLCQDQFSNISYFIYYATFCSNSL